MTIDEKTAFICNYYTRGKNKQNSCSFCIWSLFNPKLWRHFRHFHRRAERAAAVKFEGGAQTRTVSPLKLHRQRWSHSVRTQSGRVSVRCVVNLAELHNFFSPFYLLLPSSFLTWEIGGDSPPLSAAALLPSSSRLTCVITEDGLSITSSSGPQRWAHGLKLGDCPLTPSCCMKLTYTKEEEGGERGREEKITLRKQTESVAKKHSPYNASISSEVALNFVFPCPSFGKVVGRRCQSLIQYGARLRSKFQDTNMEVSRLPIPLKVARLGGGRVQGTVASTPLTTVP